MRFVVLGLSLGSSWGNSHAGQYRALLGALASRGHEILFLEREDAAAVAEESARRDLADPHWCRLRFYRTVADLTAWLPDLVAADVIVLGSGVADAGIVAPMLREAAAGITVFADLDTPATLAGAEEGEEAGAILRSFDLYLCSAGGLAPGRIGDRHGIATLAFPPWVDLDLYRPVEADRRWDLGFMGRYHAGRQVLLERLLIEPARRMPRRRFVVAGAGYPETVRWPANVERIEDVPAAERAEFQSSLGWALSLPLPALAEFGWSPPLSLLEAAACGAPVITPGWRGLSALFVPGIDLLVADGADDVVAALGRTDAARDAVARSGRARVRMAHTAAHRASALEAAAAVRLARLRRRSAKAVA